MICYHVTTVWRDRFGNDHVIRGDMDIPRRIATKERGTDDGDKDLLDFINAEYQIPGHPDFVCVEVL